MWTQGFSYLRRFISLQLTYLFSCTVGYLHTYTLIVVWYGILQILFPSLIFHAQKYDDCYVVLLLLRYLIAAVPARLGLALFFLSSEQCKLCPFPNNSYSIAIRVIRCCSHTCSSVKQQGIQNDKEGVSTVNNFLTFRTVKFIRILMSSLWINGLGNCPLIWGFESGCMPGFFTILYQKE